MDTHSSFTSSSFSSSSDDQETKPCHVDKFFLVHPVVQTRRTFMAGWTCSRVLIATYIIAVFFFEVQAEVDGPCMGCRLFNEYHRHHPEKDQKDTAFCHFPCQCRIEELSCQDGVSEIKDGCGCCYMCARQMGDMCSVRDLCDTAKNLYCDKKDDNSTGLCKGRDKNPCMVDGVRYNDGEKFQPECSQLCTCQNGFYGCINTCPQELQKPSELTCHEPKLIQVKNKCCKEWSCQKMEASGMAGLAQDRGLHSDNLILQNPMWYQTSTSPSLEEPAALSTASFQICDKKTTDWTPCSATCDVGVSIRILVSPTTCHSYQELRLCYLRPCGTSLDTLGREKCTPTTRSGRRYHIRYQDCISVKDYNLKFCTTCKKNRCCYPYRTRQRILEFQCSDGKRELYQYMWVKKCRCERTCDPRQNRQQRKGRNRRTDEDNQRRRRYK